MPVRTLSAQELRELKRSAYSQAWGDLDTDAMDALSADVDRRGVMHPARVLGGEVVDGWHRVQAAIAVGASCDVETIDPAATDAEIVALVTAENALRRNLTKGEAAEALAELRLDEYGHSSASLEVDAALIGCDERTIQRGRAVVRERRGIAPPPGGRPEPEDDPVPSPATENDGDPAIPQESWDDRLSPSATLEGKSEASLMADAGLDDPAWRARSLVEAIRAVESGIRRVREAGPRCRRELRSLRRVLHGLAEQAGELPVNVRRRHWTPNCMRCGQALAGNLVDGLRQTCPACLDLVDMKGPVAVYEALEERAKG